MTVKRRKSVAVEFGVPRFRLGFLAARFWLTWGKLFCLWGLTLMPRAHLMRIGGVLGNYLYKYNKKRRRYGEINLKLCFPELDHTARDNLLREHFRYYARSLLDMGLILWGSQERLQGVCDFNDGDRLCDLARRAPLIIVSYHTTAVDVGGGLVNCFHPMVSIMKRDKNPLLNWQLWRGRVQRDASRIKLLMRDQGLREVVRALQAGWMAFVIPDEDFGISQNTVFADFFGVATSTLTSTSRLAKITAATVVPLFTELDASSGRYIVTLGEPLKSFPSDDVKRDASALNSVMENLIRQAPHQYMWTYQWFK